VGSLASRINGNTARCPRPVGVTLVVNPHSDPRKAGIFVTELPDGTPIQSHQPLLTAARALLAAGCAPETRMEMRHDGSAHSALTSTVGAAFQSNSDGDGVRSPQSSGFSKLTNCSSKPKAR
jgi:hypothetical protein